MLPNFVLISNFKGLREDERTQKCLPNDDILKLPPKLKINKTNGDNKDLENNVEANGHENKKSGKTKDEDKQCSKEKQTEIRDKILSENKQTKCQAAAAPHCDLNQKNFDEFRHYENWSPRIPSLENICQKYDEPGESVPLSNSDAGDNLNHDALLLKMKQKMKNLIDEQFTNDYKVVLNNVQGAEIESKFSYFAPSSDLQKFRNFVEEFDSVNCLIR